MKRIVILGLGYGFLVLGVIGLFLPLLQGVLFIVIGLLLLTRETSWAQRLLDRLKAQHPRVDAVVGRAETIAQRLIVRVETWLRRTFGGATS